MVKTNTSYKLILFLFFLLSTAADAKVVSRTTVFSMLARLQAAKNYLNPTWRRDANFCFGVFNAMNRQRYVADQAIVDDFQSLIIKLGVTDLNASTNVAIASVRAHEQTIGLDPLKIALRAQDVVLSQLASETSRLHPLVAAQLSADQMEQFLGLATTEMDRSTELARGGMNLHKDEEASLRIAQKVGLPGLTSVLAMPAIDALRDFPLMQTYPQAYMAATAVFVSGVVGFKMDLLARVVLSHNHQIQSLQRAFESFIKHNQAWSYWSVDVPITSSLARAFLDAPEMQSPTTIQLMNLVETKSVLDRFLLWVDGRSPLQPRDRTLAFDVLMERRNGTVTVDLVLRSSPPATIEELRPDLLGKGVSPSQ